MTNEEVIEASGPTMSDSDQHVTPEEFAQLQEKFSEIKLSINNLLAGMMSLSEASQRRPEFYEKLARTVLTKAPLIVSSLQEFTQLLNEKTVSHVELVQLHKKFAEIKSPIINALAVMMARSEYSQRHPDSWAGFSLSREKLPTTVLSNTPQIVSSLQEFTQALNEKAGVKPSVAGEAN